MAGVYIKEFDEVSDDVLREGLCILEKELNRRKATRKEKLISDFEKAFTALISEGVDIAYCDEPITNFDNFEFWG